MNEQNMLVAAISGDQAAFGRLVAMHQSPVRAFARRITGGNPDRADDLAQDAFIAAWKKLASWRREGSFKSWVMGILWHRFLEEERTGKRRRDLLDLKPEAETSVSQTTEIRLDIERAMATLNPAESAAISLCLKEGLSISEASLLLDMPEGTVKSHISRGRSRLKDILSAEEGRNR